MTAETPSKNGPSRKRSGGRIALRFAGLALFALLLCVSDVRSIFHLLVNMNLPALAAALALAAAMIAWRGVRWWLLLRAAGLTPGILRCLQANVVSLLLSLLTPGRVGEFGKGFLLGLREPAALARSMGTVVIDRLWDVSLILVFGVLSTIHLGMRAEIDPYPIYLGTAVAAMLAGGCVVLWRVGALASLERKLRSVLGLGQGDSLAGLRDFSRLALRTSPWALAMTIAGWIIQFAMACFLATAIGLDLSVTQVVFFVAANTLVSLLPISFSGIGTRDGVFILTFVELGHTPESAVAYSMCFLLINLYLALIGTAALLMGRPALPDRTGA